MTLPRLAFLLVLAGGPGQAGPPTRPKVEVLVVDLEGRPVDLEALARAIPTASARDGFLLDAEVMAPLGRLALPLDRAGAIGVAEAYRMHVFSTCGALGEGVAGPGTWTFSCRAGLGGTEVGPLGVQAATGGITCPGHESHGSLEAFLAHLEAPGRSRRALRDLVPHWPLDREVAALVAEGFRQLFVGECSRLGSPTASGRTWVFPCLAAAGGNLAPIRVDRDTGGATCGDAPPMPSLQALRARLFPEPPPRAGGEALPAPSPSGAS